MSLAENIHYTTVLLDRALTIKRAFSSLNDLVSISKIFFADSSNVKNKETETITLYCDRVWNVGDFPKTFKNAISLNKNSGQIEYLNDLKVGFDDPSHFYMLNIDTIFLHHKRISSFSTFLIFEKINEYFIEACLFLIKEGDDRQKLNKKIGEFYSLTSRINPIDPKASGLLSIEDAAVNWHDLINTKSDYADVRIQNRMHDFERFVGGNEELTVIFFPLIINTFSTLFIKDIPTGYLVDFDTKPKVPFCKFLQWPRGEQPKKIKSKITCGHSYFTSDNILNFRE